MPRGKSGAARKPAERELSGLQRQFRRYRQERRRGGRIPEELRLRALEAVSAGVPAAALLRSCGVTRAQLERWQQEHGHGDGAEQRARVLTVEPAAGGGEAVELEVRVGPWRVSLSRVG